MSDAKAYRAKMKEKARRLAGQKNDGVTASTWKPDEPMDADVKTGMRPISKRQFKNGGKVFGKAAKQNAGRPTRKAGGGIGDQIINRDAKEANQERDGKKHVGGMQKGGRAKKLYGGGLYGMQSEHGSGPGGGGGMMGAIMASGKGDKGALAKALSADNKGGLITPKTQMEGKFQEHSSADAGPSGGGGFSPGSASPGLWKKGGKVKKAGGRIKKEGGGGTDASGKKVPYLEKLLATTKPKADADHARRMLPWKDPTKKKAGGRIKKQGGGEMMPPPDDAAPPPPDAGAGGGDPIDQKIEELKAQIAALEAAKAQEGGGGGEDAAAPPPDEEEAPPQPPMKRGGAAKNCGGRMKKADGGRGYGVEEIKSKNPKPKTASENPATTNKTYGTPKGYGQQMGGMGSGFGDPTLAKKSGGRAKKALGGPNGPLVTGEKPFTAVSGGLKSGGRTAKADGGPVKGRTNINIIIAPQGKDGGAQPLPPDAAGAAPPPPPPDMGGAPPAMPGLPPDGGGAGPMPGPMAGPIGGPPGGVLPPGLGAMLAEAKPRKDGGKVIHMQHGAGGGLGRLEKIRKYGSKAH